MFRTSQLLPLVLVSCLVVSGCPESGGPSADGGTATVSATSPAKASIGELVTLRAEAQTDADASQLRYQWFQTFGRVVTLTGADSAEASFTAPSFAKDEVLRFRCDVRVGSGEVSSAAVELTVVADPTHGLDGQTGDGADDGSAETDPHPRVLLKTSKGNITLELDRVNAPISVANFLQYVDDGFYDGTIFHRVIPDFVVQGGGFDTHYEQKETRPPILNEGDNGLKNLRGTVAMARTNAPNSATSQFYINLVDNDSLDARDEFPGYAVFATVVNGMDVVDEIAAVQTGDREGVGSDVPNEQVVVETVRRVTALGGGTSSGGSSGGDSGDRSGGDNRSPGTSSGG
ncbi:MAG: peptidylprolyl isomerase [Phycisphaerae bacterium]|jgi:peptidyl-prolyl cis-trans isomerase A (cyclophilin A)